MFYVPHTLRGGCGLLALVGGFQEKELRKTYSPEKSGAKSREPRDGAGVAENRYSPHPDLCTRPLTPRAQLLQTSPIQTQPHNTDIDLKNTRRSEKSTETVAKWRQKDSSEQSGNERDFPRISLLAPLCNCSRSFR